MSSRRADSEVRVSMCWWRHVARARCGFLSRLVGRPFWTSGPEMGNPAARRRSGRVGRPEWAGGVGMARGRICARENFALYKAVWTDWSRDSSPMAGGRRRIPLKMRSRGAPWAAETNHVSSRQGWMGLPKNRVRRSAENAALRSGMVEAALRCAGR